MLHESRVLGLLLRRLLDDEFVHNGRDWRRDLDPDRVESDLAGWVSESRPLNVA